MTHKWAIAAAIVVAAACSGPPKATLTVLNTNQGFVNALWLSPCGAEEWQPHELELPMRMFALEDVLVEEGCWDVRGRVDNNGGFVFARDAQIVIGARTEWVKLQLPKDAPAQ